MNLEQRINAFSTLGDHMNGLLEDLESTVKQSNTDCSEWIRAMDSALLQNPWFIRENILYALKQWAGLLNNHTLNSWIRQYGLEHTDSQHRSTVGVVNAGNIPLVGFHDFLSVLICGHNYLGKNASDDSVLLPYIASVLQKIAPEFSSRISFSNKLSGFDAVIATGSNNTSRYFEYYFAKVPHIIRKNRNAVSILNGNETPNQLHQLGDDIFRYFGMGCRNVSKMYVPQGYNFDPFFESILTFQEVMNHNKYMNNFEYNNTVYLLKTIPFLQNGFLIIKEDVSVPSPIAVVHYEYYTDQKSLLQRLAIDREKIQCIVAARENELMQSNLGVLQVDFGKTQQPSLVDYADGIDTIRFLTGF